MNIQGNLLINFFCTFFGIPFVKIINQRKKKIGKKAFDFQYFKMIILYMFGMSYVTLIKIKIFIQIGTLYSAVSKLEGLLV